MFRKKLESVFKHRKSPRKTTRHYALQTDYQLLEARHVLATILWDGGGVDPTVWGDPQNWVGDVLPGSTDDAVIDIAANPTIVVSSNQTVNSVVSEEAIAITGGTFTINADSEFNATLSLSSPATIDITSSTATLSGQLDWASASTIRGAGGMLDVTTGGVVNVDNGVLDNVTLNNEGVVNQVRSLSLTDATINNLSGGTWNWNALAGYTFNGTGSVFNNQSLFVKTGNGGIPRFDIPFVNETGGTLQVSEGNLSLPSSATQSGVFDVTSQLFFGGDHDFESGVDFTGTGIISFNSGTFDFLSGATYAYAGATNFNTSSVTVFQPGATLDLIDANLFSTIDITTNTATLSGQLDWTNTSTIRGSGGTLNVASGGVINGGNAVLDNVTLNNEGVVNQVESLSLTDATINNLSGGTWNWNALAGYTFNGTGSVFNNQSLFVKTGNGGIPRFDIPFVNETGGTLQVSEGNLSLPSSATQSGVFDVTSQLFFGGDHDFESGVDFTGTGIISFNSGTFDFLSGATYAYAGATNFNTSSVTVFQPGATLDLIDANLFSTIDITTNTATLSGQLDWTNTSTIRGSGGTLNVASGGVINGGNAVLDNVTLNNEGVVNQVESLSLTDATINNLSGGTWNWNALAGYTFNGTGSVFNNQSLFVKTGNGGIPRFDIPFVNETGGTLQVSEGNLSLPSSATQSGVFDVTSQLIFGGDHDFESGVDFTGTGIISFNSGTFDFLSGATYAYAGATNFNTSSVTVFQPGATLDLIDANLFSTIDITTNTATLSGQLDWTNTSTIRGSGGTLNVASGGVINGGNAVLDNVTLNNEGVVNQVEYLTLTDATINNLSGGTWNWNALAGYTFNGTGSVFNNQSLFVKTGNGGIPRFDIPFVNETGGTLQVSEGNLSLPSSATQSGVFDVTSQLIFGGDHDFESGVDFTGAGIISFNSGTFDFLSGATYAYAGATNFNTSSVTVFQPGATLDLIDANLFSTIDITTNTATLSGQLDWTNTSTIRGSGGTLNVASGGVINGGNAVLDNVTLNNEGVVNQVESLSLTDATINNLSGGTWNWNALAGYTFNGTGSVFNNQSLFVKTGNGGIPRFDIPFVNETGGTLQVSEGNLSLPSSATQSGVFDVTSQLIFGGDHDFESGVDFTGAGIISFNSGTFDFLSGATYAYAGATNFNTSSVTVFQPGATLDLIDANLFSTIDITTNTATLSGQLDWTSASTIRGAGGMLDVASGGVINVDNAVLDNVTLNNEGVVNQVRSLSLTDATINNLSGGTWNWNALGSFAFIGTGSVFNNQSLFVKTGNSGIPRFNIPFVNETGGTLQVSEGNLSLPSSATHSGVFDVTSQLIFGGDHDFESGVDFTGTGIISFNSGTFDFLSGATYAYAGATNFYTSSVTVFQPGATLDLIDANLFSTLDITSNTATLSGQLDWTNTSTIRGAGGMLDVTTGGVVNVDNGVLDNVTLNNEGVVNQVRSLSLTDATINNLSGGTWNWNALGSFAFNGTGSVFNNQSLFVKTGNSGFPGFNIPFVNETGGTLQVSEGNLSLPSSATHSGVFDVTSQLIFGGDHDFESGVDFTGTGIISFNSGTFDFLSGATYAYAGATNFNTSSVTVFQPGATLDLIDANLFSTLDITSNTATLSGQLDWTNTSTIRGSGGTLNVASGGVINGGNAVLDNVTLNNEGVVNQVEFLTLTDATINNLSGGTWNWNALGSFTFNGTGSVFNNQSLFVKTGNGGTPGFNIPFVNETGGTLQVDEGNLFFQLALTNGGNLHVSPGALVTNGASTFTQTGGQTIVDGTLSASNVVIDGGLLGGRGNIPSSVTTGDGATVAPGNSPGILNTGDFTFANDSNFEVEIGGTTEGNDDDSHDQLNVSGTVTIGSNVALDTIQWNGFNPSFNDTFTIINNDGVDAVTGTFAGLAEGSLITDFMGIGAFASISYSGGDGNDVVLTALEVSLMVSNSNDSGAGSLRQAILDSNALASITNIIDFSGLPAGTVITLDNNLPAITVPVIIDGYTASGASPNSQVIGSNAVIGIELDGSTLGSSAVGLDVLASDVVIRGLAMTGFGTDGSGGSGIATGVMIRVDSAFNNVTVAGNHLGTDSAGSGFNLGSKFGVTISGGNGHVIGGSSLADRNVISGNDVPLLVQDASNVTVSGNYIGVSASGLIDMGNNGTGVWVNNSGSGHTIGGLTDAERNVISGNNGNGITISGSGVNTVTILGNYIGTDANGMSAIPNGVLGIRIHEANFNTIGGSTSDARNVISGNTSHGISLIGGFSNTISGNFIGTSIDGTTDLGNAGRGISANGSTDNLIGGSSIGQRNIISGNADVGISLAASSDNNIVIGNHIGADQSGDELVGNAWSISISDSGNNRIGGGLAGERNIIGQRVLISGANQSNTVNNKVQGNYIGIGLSGAALGTASSSGVRLHGMATANVIGTDSNGTNDASEGNVISNRSVGIVISGSGTDSNVVAGNLIGTNTLGSLPIGNSQYGVFIDDGAENNLIGGTTENAKNVIGGSGLDGIFVRAANGNRIIGNYIGTDAQGNDAIANADNGVHILSSSNSIIGVADSGNVISGNGKHGILMERDDATPAVPADNNTIQGNIIGLNADGDSVLGNNQQGIRVSASIGNQIGGTNSGEENVVSGNGNFGILVTAAEVAGSGSFDGAATIEGNLIGTDSTGTLIGFGNVGGGISATSLTIIGGSVFGAGNVISGNIGDGISTIESPQIQGNYIGTDVSGSYAIGNTRHGISKSISDSITIGGSGANEGNVISGNGNSGIYFSGVSNSTIVGNLIGLSSDGLQPVGNATGITLDLGSNDNTIGGLAPGSENVISGNAAGIAILAPDNSVIGNFIGTKKNGIDALGNRYTEYGFPSPSTVGSYGVYVSSAGTLITQNVVADTEGPGIWAQYSSTSATGIFSNWIGTNSSGVAGLGNIDGVLLTDNASGISIGDEGVVGSGNVISGNLNVGINAVDVDSLNVQGNWIGVDGNDNPLGNSIGVRIADANPNTTLGSDIANGENVIAFNAKHGVQITVPDLSSLDFLNNQIFGNVLTGIDLGGDDIATPNDDSDLDGYLNFPVITSTVIDGGNLVINGFSGPSNDLRIFVSDPSITGFGQGVFQLGEFREGSVDDLDATSGTYTSADANGLEVGTDTTNRFSFSIPVPAAVELGSLISVYAVGDGETVSEFSNAKIVSEVGTDGPGSSLPPVILPIPNVTIVSGTRLTQTVTIEDFDSTSWTAMVDYGDGTMKAVPVDGRQITLDHVYPGPNDYTVTVTVIDNAQQVTEATFNVLIANEAPSVTVNSFTITSPVNEGAPVTLSGRFTDSGITETHTVEIDWGDETGVQTLSVPAGEFEFRVSHVYKDNAPLVVYHVAVTVIDASDESDVTPNGVLLAEVRNVDPDNLDIEIVPNSIVEGNAITLNGSFDDPGVLDTHTVTVDWGDGETTVVSLAAGDLDFSGITHTYDDDQAYGVDEYEITVSVTDKEEFVATTASRSIAVINDIPEVNSLLLNSMTTATIDENGIVTLEGTIVDSGLNDSHTILIDWGDGSSPTTIQLPMGIETFSQDHRYLDDPEAGATYTISVRVADNDMVFGTFGDANTIDITVLNKAPIIDPAIDTTLAPVLLTDQFGVELTGPVKEGDTVVLTGYFSDVGTPDRHNIMIDWNDGSAPQQASINSQTRTYTATHTFLNNGLGANDTAGIQVTITDDDGDTGNVTTDLIVGNVNPIVLISPEETNVDPNRISLLSKVVDPGSTDTFQYKWEAWPGAVTGAPTQSQVTDSADPSFDPLVDPHFQLDRTGDPDGVYTVRLTVTDDNGGETQFETAILVGTNSADTLTINNATLDDVGATNLMVLGLVGEDVIDASSVTAGYNLILDGGVDTDVLFGGAGDDTFYLRNGDDSANVTIADGGTFDPVAITGSGFESGNDRYLLTPNSTLTVIDHSGLNTLDFVNSNFGVAFDLTLADGTSQVVATTFNGEGDEVDHNVSADGQFMELVGSSYGDTLTAADGSMVRAGAGDDMLMVADVDNAAFRGDDGADTLTATGTLGRIDFNGDDGSDVFNNLGSATDIVFSGGADNDVFMNSGTATGMIDFTGDDGADVFENIGSAGDIVFTGGADNDLFMNQGTTSGTINFSGDDGADVFKNLGNAADILFSGGADNDLFTNTGTDVNLINFNGDDGADLFENDGSATQITFNGGSDNDVFNNNSVGSNQIDFNGDDGADVFNNLGSATDITFTGGADSDVFNNQSTGSSMIDFTGDDGADVFNNLGDATVINFTGGADNDVFNNQGMAAGTIDFQGDDGADLFENTGNATNIIFTGGADNDVFRNIGGAGSIDFSGDDGADALRNTGSADAIIFTGGADGDVFLNTGDVTNSINFTGDDGTGPVTGDDGADVFNNSGSANQIVFTGGADNDIFVNSGNVASSIDFTGDDGADAFENLGNVNQLTFTGGADNDVFRNSGDANTISFTGGADSDVFVNMGDAVGDINFTGDDGAGPVTGDDGADTFNNSGNATNIIFTGGADNDVFQNSGNATTMIDFTGDDGADAFRNTGSAQDVKFTGGADNDLFLNSGTVSVGIDFNGDDGADSLQNDGTGIGLIDFDGDDGADLFINNGSAVTSIVFTGGADNDVLVNYGTEIGSINFTGDDGNPATAGETSDDTLVIRGSGDGNGTVLFTGGVGADSFKNDAGGFVSYTFVGGADNDVFQNNADDATAISFSGGADSDLFENNGDGVSSINFTGDDGADSFYNDGSTVSSIIFTGGADNDLFLNTGEGVSNVDFTGDDGADTFANTGSDLMGILFTGDDGADVFLNQGSGLSQVVFTGGADNDLFWNQAAGSGSSDLNFTGDDGADVFINDAMGVNGISFTGGADDDGLQNNGSGAIGINFSGDDGADALINTGVDATLINFGGGADSDVFVNHAEGVSLIDFRGDQEYRYNPVTEEFEFVPISTTSDDGADTFLNQGNNVSNIIFTGGADNDVLTNNGSSVNSINFTGDDGADIFLNTGEGVSGIVFTGGADSDLLQNSGSEVNSINFTGDDGADTLINSGNQIAAINFTGDDGADVFINNGEGVSQIVFTGGADGDSFRSLGSGFSSINFTGDTGSDSFIQDGIGVAGSSVSFMGGDHNDLVAWRGSADTANVDTGGGDDYLFVSGAGLLTLVGGAGNDYYVFPGNPTADVTIVEAANADQDTLDFSPFNGQSLKPGIDGPALNLDLRVTSSQPQSSEFAITLSDGLGIEHVLGTSGADSIEGNARDNIITGADFEEVLVGPEAGERTDVQWVLLDFDLYTNAGGEIGEHDYTQQERDAIQRRMELVYWGPDESGEPNAAEPWFNVRFTQDPADSGLPADFVTIYFNETPSFGRPGGEASEVDLGNLNLGGSALVQVNGLLGGELTEADQVGSEEGMVSVGQLKPAATSENFVLLAAKIAAHELGHLMGLRHQDSFGPIGSGVHSPPGVDGFNPVYVGPVGGFEAFDHLLGSGASIGTDRFNDLNALFFGEREAVKLAYAMSDQALLNVAESGENHGDIGSAQSLTFATVTVPNTLDQGLNSAKEFFVQAISVIGSIGTPGVSDFYSFEGKAGELLNIDLASIALRSNGDATDTFIDSIIRVFDSSGGLVNYYSSDAINDDEFESSDSSIIDLLLPADGTYYLEVDTFKRVAGDDGFSEAVQLRTDLETRLNDTDPENDLSEGEALFLERLQDSLDDTDIGNYQLFIYRFDQANPTDDMDQLKGNGGTDVIFGGPGDVYGLILDVGDSATLDPGANFTRTITFTDRAASSWTGTVTWGDGSSQELTIDDSSGAPTFELSHTYSTVGTYEVVINISNDIGESVEQSFSIEVLVSTVADDDSTSTMEESPVVVNVLDNDTSNNPVTVTVVSDPTDGVATANSDGTVTYVPAINFVGNDTFEYLIDDGQGNTDVGMVTVTVSNLVDFDGRVFNDFDNDGVFDSADGEYGLAGVTIEVWTADLSTLIATAATDIDGIYHVNANAVAGDYVIIEVVDDIATQGLLDGNETAGSLGGIVDNTGDSNTIHVSVDDTASDGVGYQFAEIEPSDLFGVVWNDTNNDGLIDMGELGIGGVEITVTGVNDRGNNVTLVTISQEDGSYAVVNLRPGTYAITETQLDGYIDGIDTLGQVEDRLGILGNPGFIDGNDKFSGIELTAGSTADLYNFGDIADTGTDIGSNVTATIGFWRSHLGRDLIESLNGGQDSTELGNWMATNFPNLYGSGAVYDARRGRDISMDMTGQTNKQITKVFKYLYHRNHRTSAAGGPSRIDAQLMAVVFATYVTSSNLSGGDYAAGYGFDVTEDGIGESLVDVSEVLTQEQISELDIQVNSEGKASIMEVLTSADDLTTLGLLFDVDGDGEIDEEERRLRFLGNWLYWFINFSSQIED